MSSELDAIQERLRVLKRNLDARRSVVALDDEIAAGDVLSMNPLTAGDGEATGASRGSSA
ncbi:MAG: hypothetical protein QOC77_818 [Thermoleophilaceae bacterium]|jgi:hypothetical protein|nr:hypothetical protein [Thermoleophilaceae bacterium]